MIYDAAIVGTGPAGVSAALNLKIRNKNFIWLGSRQLSEKISRAEKIMNYPGIPAVSGAELTELFKGHIDSMDIVIVEQMVNSIMPMGGHYALMAGSEFYEAKTVILTTGVAQTGVLPGEAELLGRGVSYCATCDGMLYKGKTIAVIVTSAQLEHEVKYLAELAGQVYVFARYNGFGLDMPNITVMDCAPASVAGEKRLEAVICADGRRLEVNGLFCLRTSIQLSTLLPKLETDGTRIVVDRSMATNLPGVYAAGDCTGRPYQYTKAVGEGNIAAHSVMEYLDHQG